MDLSAETLLAILAIYCGAGVIKGAVGFGLPVTAAALLPFVVPVELALGLNAIVIIYTNLLQIRLGRAYRAGLSAAWPVMAGMVVAVLNLPNQASVPEIVMNTRLETVI